MTSIMEKIPKMKKVFCEVTVVNSVVNSSKSTCEEVYQEDFFNKTCFFQTSAATSFKYSKTCEQRTPTGLKNFSVIKRCLLLRGNLTKIVTFGTKHFVRYSRHVRYFGCPLLGGFTVKEILDEVAVDSRFVLFEVIIHIYLKEQLKI